MIDLNLPASPGSPVTPPSEAGAGAGPSTSARSPAAERAPAIGGPLTALAGLSEARRTAARQTVSAPRSGDGGERPLKRLRRTVSDGDAPSVPHTAQASTAPWRDESAMHVFRWSMIRRQPMARFLRSGPIAHIASRLRPPSQRRLFDALLCTPEERYGYLKLMSPESAGRYLLRNRDPDVLMHALAQAGMDELRGVPRADVVVDRSGWLLRAGATAAVKLNVNARIPRQARDALVQAQEQLLEQFDQAGPSARAGAVRNIIGASSFASTLDDAFRLAQTALAPQRFHALPPGERADALATLAEAIGDATYMSWQQLEELPEGRRHDALERHLTLRLDEGLAQTVPLLFDEARRLSPIPSNAAHVMVTSLISALEYTPPPVPTQQRILDLFDTQLPYLEGAERDLTLARLAESIALFSRPAEQRRVLDMVLHRTPGMPHRDDLLEHASAEGRWRIAYDILNSLRHLDDPDLRNETLNLLANQLEPHRLAAIPAQRLEELMARAAELDVPQHDVPRMLTIVVRALDALPDASLERPLQALARHEAGPLDEDLVERMQEARLRLLTRVPPQALARDASLLQGLSLQDEARLMAFRTNEATDADPRTRAATFAFVATRLSAHAAGAHGRQALHQIADALPHGTAAAWARQLEAQLDDALDLRLAPGPSAAAPAIGATLAYAGVEALIAALRMRRN